MKPFAGVLFPIETPRVTLPFADRTYQVYRDKPHRGVDLSPYPGAKGQPIRASMTMEIVAVNNYGNTQPIGNELVVRTSLPRRFTCRDLNGKSVPIEKDEIFFMRYGHNDKNLVQPGQTVRAGTMIALIGSTSTTFSSGPHLHLELRKGRYEDALVLNPLDMFTKFIPDLLGELQFS
jgi:murein DD-endopeptidase MepM/ murein hydrolase activator NlpD